MVVFSHFNKAMSVGRHEQDAVALRGNINNLCFRRQKHVTT